MNLGLCLPADWRTRWGWLRSWMKDTTRERHKGPFIMIACTAGNYWRSWVAVETFKHNLWASMYTVRLLYHRRKARLEWNVCCLSNLAWRSPSVGASFHSINWHSGHWTTGRTIPWHLCLKLHRMNVFGLREESGGMENPHGENCGNPGGNLNLPSHGATPGHFWVKLHDVMV